MYSDTAGWQDSRPIGNRFAPSKAMPCRGPSRYTCLLYMQSSSVLQFLHWVDNDGLLWNAGCISSSSTITAVLLMLRAASLWKPAMCCRVIGKASMHVSPLQQVPDAALGKQVPGLSQPTWCILSEVRPQLQSVSDIHLASQARCLSLMTPSTHGMVQDLRVTAYMCSMCHHWPVPSCEGWGLVGAGGPHDGS
jgi:hypothetical protein